MLPKLLLLTATPPGDSGVGQLFLRDICRTYSHDRLAIAAVSPTAMLNPHSEFSDVPSLFIEWPYDSFHRGESYSWLSAASRHIKFLTRSALHDGNLVRRVTSFGYREKTDILWVVLNSPTMFRVAPRIAQRLGVPMVSTVWDPPEGIGLHFGMDRFSRRYAQRDFASAMAASLRCGVISENMADEYQRMFGTTNIILRHGITESSSTFETTGPDDASVRIGFAGSMYAEREFQALLNALDELQWLINGRPVTIAFMGSQMPSVKASHPARIEFLGWRSMEEAVAELSRCHFNYLPYWFHPAYADSVRLCFATKLTTYLTAGRPVFYHGPAEAAIMRFADRYRILHGCHSLDPAVIARKLEDLALNTELQVEMVLASERAVRDELNLDVFTRRFAELVGVSPMELTRADPNSRLAAAV